MDWRQPSWLSSFRDSNLANCARDPHQPTNADKHSALWVLVVRYRQLDRRGRRVVLVVAPRAQRGRVSVSETDVASADSSHRGFRDRMYGVPVVTRWLSSVAGDRSQVVRIDGHDPQSVAILVFLFVLTAPVSEEVLYRGLLVAWLRRVG